MQPQLDPKVLWKAEGAFATSLLALMVDRFGLEFTTWMPHTVLIEIKDEFKVEPNLDNFNKLMSAVSILTSNSFYVSLPDFNDLCNILAGETVMPGVWIPADAAACAWGITEAMFISPPEDLENPFSPDITAYVGATLKSEGILVPPDVLRIVSFDKDIMEKIRFDFSDDPVMFETIYQAEQSKTEDINQFVRTRLEFLTEQLSQLNLKNGNVEKVTEKMLAALEGKSKHKQLQL